MAGHPKTEPDPALAHDHSRSSVRRPRWHGEVVDHRLIAVGGVYPAGQLGMEGPMRDENTTPSGWRYWIEAPSVFPSNADDPSLGTLVLRPIEGDDVCIELCPGYASGQAAQDELRRRIGEIVGDAEESQEIFDSTTFVMPDLIEMRSTFWQAIA